MGLCGGCAHCRPRVRESSFFLVNSGGHSAIYVRQPVRANGTERALLCVRVCLRFMSHPCTICASMKSSVGEERALRGHTISRRKGSKENGEECSDKFVFYTNNCVCFFHHRRHRRYHRSVCVCAREFALAMRNCYFSAVFTFISGAFFRALLLHSAINCAIRINSEGRE